MKHLSTLLCLALIGSSAHAAPLKMFTFSPVSTVNDVGVVVVDWKEDAKDKAKKAKDFAKKNGKKALKLGAKSAKATLPGRVAVGLLYRKTACAPSDASEC